jgi:hypothetical protein
MDDFWMNLEKQQSVIIINSGFDSSLGKICTAAVFSKMLVNFKIEPVRATSAIWRMLYPNLTKIHAINYLLIVHKNTRNIYTFSTCKFLQTTRAY